MRVILKIFLVIFIFSFFHIDVLKAQTIRIMPMGNSITYDHNSADESNPRPSGQRISYRYKLYQLLQAEGLDFDFVGSEDAGNDFFQDSQYDDNAGFPGIETWELTDLINTGYNGYSHQYVSPGPYLSSYPTDIILLHIGTNNLITSAEDVEDVLNSIRFYDSDVIILVARILNRQTYHASTTIFNNNVELMVNSRGDNRIKVVNIETGAGINYFTEMFDTWHPKQSGYDKMGVKWFDAIMKLNQSPVITTIPAQSTEKGEVFPDLSLDPYVTDLEDPDYLLAWAYEQEPGSELTVSIDANRVLHVTPDPDFSGTEVIFLKVKDTGNGAFPRTDSIEVNFVVDHVNSPPFITSQPETIIQQGATFTYTVLADDVDEDPLTYSALEKPAWLTFNVDTHFLTGIPEHSDVGEHEIIIRVSDGFEFVDQEFQVQVIDVNDPPVMTSASTFEMLEDVFQTFTITAEDLDGDYITYSVISKPSWLSFNSTVHSLAGKPTNNDVGEYNMTVKLSDGTVDVYESLRIIVTNINDLPVITSTPITAVSVGSSYIYRFTASDIDPDAVLVYSVLHLPEWLNFTTSSTDALIYGTSSAEDFGSNLVILQVTDGHDEVLQAFTIQVSFSNEVDDEAEPVHRVYPNPANSKIIFELVSTGRLVIRILNTDGKVMMEASAEDAQSLELDISNLQNGIFIYQVYLNSKESVGKFIKN